MGFLDRFRRPARPEPHAEPHAERPGDPVDGMSQDPLGSLVLEGHALLEQSAQAHHAAWGLGSAETWGLEQSTGLLTFDFPDKVVTAPAQILGSYSMESRSFLWAWANQSIVDELSQAAAQARAYGEEHGIGALTAPRLDDLEESAAADLVALAFRVTGATGFYRDASAAAVPYVFFGPVVTITPHRGEPSEFRVSLDD